jgi:quercetin dioxygenase-like cupin family protein
MNQPQAMSVSELAAYQDGSIVSKMIIDKKAGSVTFFAFDKGQGLSEHTAPFDAMVIIVDGEAEITISGTKYHVKNGDTLIMPAHQPHALYAREKFKMILIMIRDRDE